MTRAERRRAEKAAKKKPATYNLTIEQVDAMVKEKINNDIEGIRQEVIDRADEATNRIMTILFGLPCIILKEHYWKKSPEKKFLEFAELMMQAYQDWQNDVITDEQIKAQVWDIAGIAFEESE